MKTFRLTPVTSITYGIVSLTILMFLALDNVVGIIPDAEENLRQIRENNSINLSSQLSTLIQSENEFLLRRTLSNIQKSNKDILSIGIRNKDKTLVAHGGPHLEQWRSPPNNKSTINLIQVPLHQNDKLWGKIEISYRAENFTSFSELIKRPIYAIPISIIFLGSFIYYIYLRKVLNHLDPSKVIPDRVNTALDTLTEGILIIDKKERVLLTNESFKHLHPEAVKDLSGKKISTLKWLVKNIVNHKSSLPWQLVLNTHKPVHQITATISQPDGRRKTVSINASPVRDGQAKVQGCMITFSDITDKERINQKLRNTLEKLQVSKKKIEKQNRDLITLANYDQLTGIFNRRAFFEQAEQQVLLCHQTNMPLACIMSDIDHFKLINDNYGHPVGDSAIKVVTKMLSRNIRQNDILGRYGGEEFCIVLPGIDQKNALEIAERMRENVEKFAGKGVRSIEGLEIRSSFGLSMLTSKNDTLSDLIEQADKALYESKANGRNQVSVYRDLVKV